MPRWLILRTDVIQDLLLKYIIVWEVCGLWKMCMLCTKHTYTRLTALFPGLPGWAGTRKVKLMWILLKQETASGSGISWAICKSAPRSRQPRQHPTTRFFTDRMPFLPPNQQCQSTEGMSCTKEFIFVSSRVDVHGVLFCLQVYQLWCHALPVWLRLTRLHTVYYDLLTFYNSGLLLGPDLQNILTIYRKIILSLS